MSFLRSADAWKCGRNILLDRVLDVWSLPNELIGYGLGYLGHGVGCIASRLGYGEPPRIEHDRERGMTNFINSPLTPMGALTIGHASMYGKDPDTDPGWIAAAEARGQTVRDHEAAHAPQSRLLGPFYLPSNIAGGLASILLDRGHPDWPWHGPSNWNERGPLENPPRPWPKRRR